jgi:hypothetical protein
MRIYKNGKFSNDQASSCTVPSSINATNNNVTIARRESTSDNSDIRIDDLRVYGYPLTDQQVRNVYNDGALRFSPNTGSP